MDDDEGEAPTLENLKAALGETVRNLDVTHEIVRHAAAGQTAHTAHLVVIEAILVEILRSMRIDMQKVRTKIGEMPKDLQSAASSVLSSLEEAGKG
jgi:hypothetical protein